MCIKRGGGENIPMIAHMFHRQLDFEHPTLYSIMFNVSQAHHTPLFSVPVDNESLQTLHHLWMPFDTQQEKMPRQVSRYVGFTMFYVEFLGSFRVYRMVLPNEARHKC